MDRSGSTGPGGLTSIGDVIRDTTRPWHTPDGKLAPPEWLLRQWRRQEQRPWTALDCPTDGICGGTYSDVLLPCPHHEKPTCLRKLEHLRIAQTDWLDACGIAPRYREPNAALIPKFPVIRDWCEAFIRGSTRGLIITGGTGTGKTMALTYVAIRAGEAHWTHLGDVRLWFAPELMSWLSNPKHDVGEPGQLPLLLLDDFGCEYPAEWTLARFGELAERRHRERLSIVVTSNLSPEAMEARPEWRRIVDRWIETCDTVTFDGASQRGAPGNGG